MLHLTGDDLRRTFPDTAVRAGRAYAAQGRVSELRISPDGPDGRSITARVRGSEAKPYRVRVQLRPQPGGRTTIGADCTCFVGWNCKHAVAAITAAQALPEPAAAAPATGLLNLTAADTVVHYDPWWSPAAEDQATDRAHRIGQDKPVFVHRLIAQGTAEERMEALLAPE